ncbi:MAG: two-component system response regulator [Deltaproteobacteria bacterium RIFOXYA12_FULL_58_15]|nr:MAG: two-component system response regulator [Deltaproteobacteria bacterium RIFOXYA12_FULL_58_15]OGR11627.1 MAG: two-component system response regulator [Deltaproteobacteria bacterium RIFOXYB12_FULL_58_9]
MADYIRGKSVLLVDDDLQNLRLLAAILRRGGLEPRPVKSGKLAIEAAVADPPDLVLLDVQMPEMSGLEVCRWFKQDERLKSIPILFISVLSGIDDKVEAFRVGAIDYVSKPFQEQDVLARVKTQLRLRGLQVDLVSHNQELEQRIDKQVKIVTASQQGIIFALAKLAESRDDDTGQHIERVQTFSRVLAEQMRKMGAYPTMLNAAFVDNLHQTASLHDIGKVGTPDAILLKPGKLTATEFEKMKKHCALGSNTLATVLERHPDNPFLRMGVDVARSHHEKWDGSGYPDNLEGQAIPLAARIVAVADFYDALSSKRCYRPARSHEETCRMIHAGSGTHFDPIVVTAFSVLEHRFRQIRQEMQDP